jgi:hypothetical protein
MAVIEYTTVIQFRQGPEGSVVQVTRFYEFRAATDHSKFVCLLIHPYLLSGCRVAGTIAIVWQFVIPKVRDVQPTFTSPGRTGSERRVDRDSSSHGTKRVLHFINVISGM